MKLIALSQGKFAQVDDEDFEAIAKHKWHAWKRPSGKGVFYARRNVKLETGRKTIVSMHNQIIGAPIVDHINGDGLDNTRKNLRPCTISQNNANKRKNTRGTYSSKMKGVYFFRTWKKWVAQVKVAGRTIHLGGFDTEGEAGAAYNQKSARVVW